MALYREHAVLSRIQYKVTPREDNVITLEDDPTTGARRLGARIRGHRLIAGMELEDVERVTGIPVSTLAAYETGKRTPGVYRAMALARAYDVTVEELFAVEGDE
jgi:DNA-binding XRE family transcriptional regulator